MIYGMETRSSSIQSVIGPGCGAVWPHHGPKSFLCRSSAFEKYRCHRFYRLSAMNSFPDRPESLWILTDFTDKPKDFPNGALENTEAFNSILSHSVLCWSLPFVNNPWSEAASCASWSTLSKAKLDWMQGGAELWTGTHFFFAVGLWNAPKNMIQTIR